jgi:integrase
MGNVKHAPRRQRLTELAVRKLKGKSSTYLIWDTHQRSLALRVQPTGRRSWYVVYSRRGRPRWLRLGDAGVIGLAAARELAVETLLAVARGKDPAAERRAERGRGSFEELAQRYVETYAKRRNKSWAQADTLVKRYLLPRWGKLQAAAIMRADVKALMSGIAAPVLANQVLAAASAIFSWAVKEELLASNPCRGVDRNATKSRERVLSDSELPRFWSAFEDIGLVASSALKTILLTGQRPGEVAHMRHEHIVDGWWEMPGAPVPVLGWPGTKNGASHRVWLPQPVREILAEMNSPTGEGGGGGGGGGGFVFAGERGRAITRLDMAMRDVCAELGVERATPHDLRRTHGSTITALGFGRDAMNRIQNHKEGGIADVYDVFRYEVENKRIMEAVARKIMTLIEGADEKVVPIRR